MDHVFCVRHPITGTVLPMRNDRASVGKILLGLTISTSVAEIVSQSNPVRSGSQINRWKEANVILVPEVYTARSITSDLRPIADCDARGKVLESFVGSWILQTVESNLDGRQYGGLKRRSTTHTP